VQRRLLERDDGDPVDRLQQSTHGCIRRNDHLLRPASQQWQVTGKLDDVAKPLLGVDQDRLVADVLACPEGLRATDEEDLRSSKVR
jgi:hypothetical protein